ncbi:protochlorophyllide-dependent translocon component 52 chloroplastic [Phtheirospermum japonicum]|uniref:Protochlorophyllide-dependent translocon component 52 chloroplastic n=1 Tax=Phtheirospermum japonicum TaxID=374723 RepID=A0A830C0H8_9LAMI|nr:protochlorophyllide-dependent translocon component 52 chloroplastic [Phtheirospermum japonicum]
MEALKASSFPSFHRSLISSKKPKPIFEKPIPHIPSLQQITKSHPIIRSKKSNFRIFTAVSPTEELLSTDQEIESEKRDEKFDWYANWYPVMPICDLDKRRPHGKKVMGIDIVIWWDKNENAWKVFDDSCPHRLAPLSEGRIDQWGRLQCVYHGWCFGGSGDCKFIPQAPRDGPPIHTSKKACVAVYPSCVQNGILWFWPNSDPQYKDILSEKKPHYIPELDDPSYTNQMICRDIPYGPGYSRMIFVSPRNFAVWIDRIFPRWIFHIGQNLIVDSDLYLLHVEERKLMDIGALNWQKACYVPTKSDALVVSFRRWLNKYGGTKVDWGTKFSGLLPPTPHREQLLDRYWTHTVSCSSCSNAYKYLNVLQIALQVISVSAIGLVAATKQGIVSVAARYTTVCMAVLCFVASKWLSHFIYKTFRYHDYDHAFR